MARLMGWIGAGLLALALGVGSAGAMILWGGAPGARITNGVWETGRDTGSGATDPYSRARIAIFGLWALPPEEVVYYTAYTDEDGQALRHDCRYEVRGHILPARWFSLTAYRDFHLIPNPAQRHSWSATTLERREPGEWVVSLNASGEGVNGLPMGRGDGVLALSLRLYQPDPIVAANRASLALPRIVRMSCAREQ